MTILSPATAPRTTPERVDYDSPWKEAISAYFQPFMQLFFPAVHARIDWSQPDEFVDAELLKITGDAQIGKRFANRLVRVRRAENHQPCSPDQSARLCAAWTLCV